MLIHCLCALFIQLTMYYFFGALLSIMNKTFNMAFGVKPFQLIILSLYMLFICFGITLIALMIENVFHRTFYDNMYIHNMIAVLAFKIFSIVLGFYTTNFIANVISKMCRLITLDLFI